MFKEVFISYVKEDQKYADELYDFLTENGYEPWLDKRKLKVGANWDYEIKKALKKSTFVVLLLSSISVKKRGYVQKEFKYALEYSESKLLDDIYIIPVLLDKCVVPDQLSSFHWAEFADADFKNKILDSLNCQREKYIASMPPAEVSLNNYTTVSIDLKTQIKNLDYNCNLPLFHNNNYFDANFVNPFIQQKALEAIDLYRKIISESSDYLKTKDNFGYIEINGNVSYITPKYLSLSIVYESYLGGAHPNTFIDTLNFRLNPETILTFSETVNYENLQNFLIDSINKFGDKDQKYSLPIYCEYITEDNINFTFNKNSIEIIFINHLPRVIMALGFLEIPLNKINHNL